MARVYGTPESRLTRRRGSNFFGGLPLSSGKREAFVSGRPRHHENVNAMERIYYIETAFGHSICQAAEEGEHHVQEHG